MPFKMLLIFISLLFLGCYNSDTAFSKKSLPTDLFLLTKASHHSMFIQEPFVQSSSLKNAPLSLNKNPIEETEASCFYIYFQDFKETETKVIPSETVLAKYNDHDKNGKPCPTDVVIPEGVTLIRQIAFSDKGLTSVVIPNSVRTIEDYAFEVNDLFSLTIPPSVKTIGVSAFERNKLQHVSIESEKLSIKRRAFRDNGWFNYVCIKGHRGNVTIDKGAFDFTTRVEHSCPRPHP